MVCASADVEQSPSELEQFVHCYRLPTPYTYRSMLSTAGIPKHKLDSSHEDDSAGGLLEPSSKRYKAGDEFLRRVRSLVQPLQVHLSHKHCTLYLYL